jgi:2-iminobutanoate/2-iminopropanoate deaminase
MDNFPVCNKIYEKYFPGENKPARSCVAVKTLPRNCKFEMELIAFVPKN